MTTTFTKTELAELLSIAQAENKELKADNSILNRDNKRIKEERDDLYKDIASLGRLKFKSEEDYIKDLSINIVDRLVKEGLIKDCLDTNDETEFEFQDIVEEVLMIKLLRYNDIRESNNNENINSVVWYAWNYDYNFIAKCWENQGSLILHLEDKFSKLVRSNGKTAFFLFLAELDDTNRSILYDFILRTFSKKKGFLQ